MRATIYKPNFEVFQVTAHLLCLHSCHWRTFGSHVSSILSDLDVKLLIIITRYCRLLSAHAWAQYIKFFTSYTKHIRWCASFTQKSCFTFEVNTLQGKYTSVCHEYAIWTFVVNYSYRTSNTQDRYILVCIIENYLFNFNKIKCMSNVYHVHILNLHILKSQRPYERRYIPIRPSQ